MNQTGSLCFNFILILLCSIGYTWSVHRFCIIHFTCIRHRIKPILFLLSISLPLIDTAIITNILPYPVGIFAFLFWQILLILSILLLYHGETAQKILAASLLLTVTLLVQNFAESLPMCIILIVLHSMHIEFTPLINYVLDCFIYCVTFSCVIWSILFLTKRMTDFFANRLHRWYIMLSVPLSAIIILWDFIHIGASYGILLRGGDHLNLYYNQIFSHAGICVLSILCIGGVSFYIFGMDKIDIEQKQKEQYRSQVAFYHMLEEQYQSLERLRHDMKNHIIGLLQLTDNRECDQKPNKSDCESCLRQTRNYLHKLADAGGIEYADDLTGKSIMDALLYYKHNQANKEHIHWECHAHIPPTCSIDDFDLCVIFGNLLDNALEACTKISGQTERFIQIHAHMIKKCLMIEIVNSMEITSPNNTSYSGQKETKYSYHAGHFTSKQTVGAGHPKYRPGIGLRNVQDTITKYNGTLNIETDDNIFRVSILLPCISTAYDINQPL